MLKNFKPRLYQETIFATAAKHNTLVVLPTGMGKTSIAVMLAVHRLEHYPNSKILVLAPTKPLAEQLLQVFKTSLDMDDMDTQIVLFTGNISPAKRKALWKDARVVCSTPQGLENDIISRRINLEDVSLLVFDEAHRATGDYAYNFIAKQYHRFAKYTRILALTASPGSDPETINEVCENLFIDDIEIRTDYDPDVRPYIQEVELEWVNVDLPQEFLAIKKMLESSLQSKFSDLKKYSMVRSISVQNISRKDLLKMQAQLHAQISQGNKDFEILKSLSLTAEAMKIYHALELLETQGVAILYTYLDRLLSDARTSKVKAAQNLGRDVNIRAAYIKTERLYNEGIEHPKLDRLAGIVKEELARASDVKLIVFTQYRESGSRIIEELEPVEGCTPRLFVGQQKKGMTGMSQKKQIEMLDDFRNGSFNTIVMTSVGEEGLDIPQVNTVIFYEPIPSAVRHIQRRGRTGRLEKGRVVILVTKNTRDGGYRWSAHHKEKRMHRLLFELKQKLQKERIPYSARRPASAEKASSQSALSSFSPDSSGISSSPSAGKGIKIFVDAREKGSKTLKELADKGCAVEVTRLDSADYLVSSRCAVEFKTVPDFVDSIIDGRLLDQLRALKRNFERPVLIIEGTDDIYSVRKMHSNAILGMLATISVSYGIPVLQTRNHMETAALLLVIAKREQQESGSVFSKHAEKPVATLREQQEYVVSSLPFIGSKLARPLLEKFGTVRKVMSATEKELKDIELIGEKKAKKIQDVLTGKYE